MHFLSFLVLVLCLLPACSGSADADNTGWVTINLTDAPGPFERVDVTIEMIEIHRVGDGPQTFTAVSQGAVRVNLLTLQSGRELRLGATAVAPANYDTIRVTLAKPVVTIGGIAQELVLEQKQVRIEYPFQVANYDDRRVLLDFDARASIREDPHERLSFRPSILVKREQGFAPASGGASR